MRDNFDNFLKGLVKLTNSHCESQENPKAIITLGEQGSGKEVLALEAQDELSHRGGSVLVGADYYKTHSENYLENVKVDDRSTSINSIKKAIRIRVIVLIEDLRERCKIKKKMKLFRKFWKKIALLLKRRIKRKAVLFASCSS